jgi:hypothetical protein
MAKGLQLSSWRRSRPASAKVGKADRAGSRPEIPSRRKSAPPPEAVLAEPPPRAGAARARKISEAASGAAAPAADSPSVGQPKTRPRVSDPRPVTPKAGRRLAGLHWLSTVEGSRYTGRLFGVHRGVVYGVVRNEDKPDQPVDVEIVTGDTIRRVVRANALPHTILPVSGDLRSHGFSFPVWNWLGSRWRREARALLVRVHGTTVEIGDLSVMPRPTQLAEAGLDGYCDIVDTAIRGWVWEPEHPDHQVDVSVFVGGRFLARTTAGVIREDLRAANLGTGAYGFSIWLPAQLRAGGPHEVEVMTSESGVLLRRGRFKLHANTVTFVA